MLGPKMAKSTKNTSAQKLKAARSARMLRVLNQLSPKVLKAAHVEDPDRLRVVEFQHPKATDAGAPSPIRRLAAWVNRTSPLEFT